MDHYGYRVEFEDYTRRHYSKNFEKKYKSRWLKTVRYIVFLCEHIDKVLLTQQADLISKSGYFKLIKLDFAIFGCKNSPKASGNRCILVVDDKRKMVRILLIYSKHDISTVHETAEWKKIIKEQFPEVGERFGL